MTQRAYLRVLLFAALLGIPVSFAAALFQTALHELTNVVWHEIPDGFDWAEPPSWYVLLVPAVAGALVALCLRLPGHGGHEPLEGFGLAAVRPVELVSIVPAALVTLASGIVLGPEAPLLALGFAIGVVAVRLAHASERETDLLVLAAAFAAVAGLFGGPIVAAFFLFEVLAAGGRTQATDISRALLPGFVAAGTGALVYTGVGDWQGLDAPTLALPGLPDYPTVRLVDIAWCLPLAVLAAVLIVALRDGAVLLRKRRPTRPFPVLVTAGLAVGALALIFRSLADRPVDLVLFSGQTALPSILVEGSAGVLVLLVVTKGLAYAVSLASGFRGGPIFPAVALGAALAVLAHDVLPDLALVPALVTGIAAATAGAVGMPFFAALMATLLAGDAAVDTAPFAVLGAAVGWIAATALAKR